MAVLFSIFIVKEKIIDFGEKISECKMAKMLGTNIEIFRSDSASVNFLQLLKGGVCSYHFHKCKCNTFYLISGRVLIKTEDGVTIMSPGESVYVAALVKHQFEALEDSKMIEIMWIEYSSDDIVRETQGYLKK